MNNFYIYRYIRLDSNTPFYIGKGLGKRYRERTSGRNIYFKRIVKTIPYRVDIIVSNLSEDQAFKKEIEFIKLYRSFGLCEANFTNGGEGSSGRKMSEHTKSKLKEANKNRVLTDETRTRMSKSQTGRIGPNKGKTPWNKGKPQTEETKAKLSASHMGKFVSDETRLKMSKGGKGRVFTEEHRKNLGNAIRLAKKKKQ